MNVERKGIVKLIRITVMHVVLLFLVAIMMFPIVWMLLSSFQSATEIFVYPPKLWPETFRFQNYTSLFTELQVSYARNFVNSLFVTGSTIVGTLFFASLGGFAFAKYTFVGRKFIFYILIASLMVPFQALVLPLFILMQRFNWIDTYYALILPFVAHPFATFLMRQFMVTIPTELIEVSRIDGCTEFRIYAQIVVPLIKPAFGALTIFMFILTWNQLLWPLVILRSEILYTLPITLANFVSLYTQRYGMVLAGSVLAAIPAIVIFLSMQRYFLSGLTLGSVKQ